METDNKNIKKVQWCATEKVHGSNFCWIVSGDEIKGGNRTQVLEDTAPFFNWQMVREKIREQLRGLFGLLTDPERAKKLFPGQTAVVRAFVFGEICGGIYPDIAAPAGIQAVQTGIFYSPNIEFIAFDIAVSFASEPNVRTYMDFEVALKLLAEVSILHVQPLFVGPYTQAVNFNPRFQSGIAKQLGLPAVANNLAEGIVIRPMRSLLVPTKKGLERPIMKIKIPEFSEDKRFHTASKWAEAAPSEGSWQTPETRFADLSYEISSLTTMQRLENVISKFGHITVSDKARLKELLDLYTNDVIETVLERFPEQWDALTEMEKVDIKLPLQREALKVLKEYFVRNLPSSSSSSK